MEKILEIIGVIFASTGVTALGAWILGGKWVDHRLTLERTKAQTLLQDGLKIRQTELEATTRKQVEKLLADEASERQYKYDAKKRLYEAVGPFRFQLLLACRDLATRVEGHGRKNYAMEVDQYYARSFMYRILQPFAIFELIERKMSQADFTVDPAGIDLLKFNHAAVAILSGNMGASDHPLLDMENQNQHIFKNKITSAACALIVSSEGKERCMRYGEFEQFSLAMENGPKLEPFRTLLQGFEATRRPLFWLRIVALAHLSSIVVNSLGKDIGFSNRAINLEDRLKLTNDPTILREMNKYVKLCDDAANLPL